MKLSQLLNTTGRHIRSRLFRDLVLLVLFTVGTLVTVSYFLIGELKENLVETRISSVTALVRDEVRNLLGPVEQQLLIARDGLRTARVSPSDHPALDERLAPSMQHIQQIAGTIYADDAGNEYFLVREDAGWVTRMRTADNPGKAKWTQWSAQDSLSTTREGDLDYDPRRRPWYTAAEPGGRNVSWSGPYVFHTLQVPGMTASVAWEDAGQKQVLAMDVTLERIIEAVEGLPLGQEGGAFLFSGNGGIYVSEAAGDPMAPQQASQFFSAQERLGGPLFIDAVAAWQDNGRPSDGLIRFKSGGNDWLGGFLPLSRSMDNAWVGVALPVSGTYDILQSRWHILALTALTIIALGVGLVLLLMRKYSRQLRDLPKLTIDRHNYEQDLYDLIGSGEDTHLELKSTMRTNLHTGKPGKEIELAWLKGVAAFLNTEGGVLLMGVADDGTLLGLDADAFENEDKCRLHFKNLLNQHLGAEYARFVRFDLYQLEGNTVGAVECERADAPAFLRNKNSESFLIRSGPSNIELSLSRALKYIRSRF